MPSTLASLMLLSSLALCVLCPLLYRARPAKRETRRAIPSYSVESMLRPDECNAVISEVQRLGLFLESKTGGGGGHAVQRSTVVRLPRGEFDWVYDKVQSEMVRANSVRSHLP